MKLYVNKAKNPPRVLQAVPGRAGSANFTRKKIIHQIKNLPIKCMYGISLSRSLNYRVIVFHIQSVRRPRASCPCWRPSVGWLPPRHLVPHQSPCKLVCILFMPFENIVFYGVWYPSTKVLFWHYYVFYRVWGFRGGLAMKKITY